MQDAVVANLAVVIYYGIAVDFCIVAHFGVSPDCNVRVEYTSVANLNTFGNGNKGTNVAIFSDFGCRVNESQFADAFAFGFHALVYLQQFRYSLSGIVNLYQRSLYFMLGLKVLIDKYYATFGLVDVMLVFVVGKETDTPRFPFLDFCEVIDCCLRVTNNGSAYKASYHFCTEFHVD